MSVAFRSAGTIGSQFSGTPTINYPSGVASGDLLVIQFVASVSTVLPTTPTGWTKLFGPISMSGAGNTNQAYLYYKIAGGSEPSSVTFANTGASNYAAGIMSAYTGADPLTPINVFATANLPTSGTTGTTPSVTTSVPDTMLLRMYWDWSNTTAITPAVTDTERYDTFWTPNNLAFELATSTQATAGTSGTTTATFVNSATSGGLSATVAVAAQAVPASAFVPQIIGVI